MGCAVCMATLVVSLSPLLPGSALNLPGSRILAINGTGG